MSRSAGERGYRIEPRNKFFEAIRGMAAHEIRPGLTVTLISDVDLTEVEKIRAAAGSERPSYTAFIAKAVALALREFPYANRRACRRTWLPFLPPRVQAFTAVDIGVAVERDLPDAPSAVFADVLRNVDKLSLAEINTWLRELATCDTQTNKQWRDFSRVIRYCPRWLSALLLRLPYYFPSLWVKWRGGAVFISSPAKYGVDTIVGTWTCPLGVSFGFAKNRAVVREGKVVACPTLNLILNFDRTIMAGAQASRFFKRIVEILEGAEREMAQCLVQDAEKSSRA